MCVCTNISHKVQKEEKLCRLSRVWGLPSLQEMWSVCKIMKQKLYVHWRKFPHCYWPERGAINSTYKFEIP